MAVIILALAIVTSFHPTGKAVYKEKTLDSYSQKGIVENIEQYQTDLRQITCYCGCEHTDLYNCYEEGMLTNCGTCMSEYKEYLSLKDTKTIQEISNIIDEKYEGIEDNDED